MKPMKTKPIKSMSNLKRQFLRERQFWFISIAALAFLMIFYFVPMLGNYMAFINYKPRKGILESDFVGLEFFRKFFSLPDVWNVLRNTLVMGAINITVGFVTPIVLALMLNELRFMKVKKVVQTVSYLPHFVSWVVVASIAKSLFATDGVVNELLVKSGVLDNPYGFLSTGKTYWVFISIVNLWKTVGWGSIIYMSAIAGVDQELFEAGAVDGVGRWGRIRHIILPGISTTIIMLFILGAGGIINGGFEQHLLLGNATTREYYETIDTYVYAYGLEMGQYSFATAVSLLKGIISITLVIITNALSRRFSDSSVF